MKKDRIYIKLQAINEQLYDLEGSFEESVSHRDQKELKKKHSKLLKEKRKLQKRLKGIHDHK